MDIKLAEYEARRLWNCGQVRYFALQWPGIRLSGRGGGGYSEINAM